MLDSYIIFLGNCFLVAKRSKDTVSVVSAIHCIFPNINAQGVWFHNFGVHLCHKLQHLMVVSVTCHDSKIYPVPMQVWQNLLGAAKHKCYKSVLRHFNNLNNPVPNEWWKSVNETCWKLGVPKLEIWRPNNCQISSPKIASLWPPTIAKLPQNGKLSHLSGEILLLNCPLEYHFSRNSPFFVSKKKSPEFVYSDPLVPWWFIMSQKMSKVMDRIISLSYKVGPPNDS